jgi:hypothetical protein
MDLHDRHFFLSLLLLCASEMGGLGGVGLSVPSTAATRETSVRTPSKNIFSIPISLGTCTPYVLLLPEYRCVCASHPAAPSRPSLYTWDTKRPKPHQEKKRKPGRHRQPNPCKCHAMQTKPSHFHVACVRVCVYRRNRNARRQEREREREGEREEREKWKTRRGIRRKPAMPLTATPISRPAARAPQTAYPSPAWTTTGRRGAPARTGHRPPRRSCAG